MWGTLIIRESAKCDKAAPRAKRSSRSGAEGFVPILLASLRTIGCVPLGCSQRSLMQGHRTRIEQDKSLG
jgi:hypothetical protein